MNNYEFCAHWVLGQKSGRDVRVLDYGCGAARIVSELRTRNIDAFGCDLYYEGGDCSSLVDADLLNNGIIKKIENGRIPFDDSSFDYVVNNQVLEHVEDLDAVLSEIHRVLKPGGTVLSLFPTREVWREGHCGIPFLHWFPKQSGVRIYYASLWRALGFGYHKKDKGVVRWSRDFCAWLDDWTHYRRPGEIKSSYRRHFRDIVGIEDRWLRDRLGDKRRFVALLPKAFQGLLVRKLCGLVLVAHKPVQPEPS